MALMVLITLNMWRRLLFRLHCLACARGRCRLHRTLCIHTLEIAMLVLSVCLLPTLFLLSDCILALFVQPCSVWITCYFGESSQFPGNSLHCNELNSAPWQQRAHASDVYNCDDFFPKRFVSKSYFVLLTWKSDLCLHLLCYWTTFLVNRQWI